MKVLLDTNIWLAYFLAGKDDYVTTYIVWYCTTGMIELLFPDELAQEIRHSVVNHPHLSGRLTYQDVENYLDLVRQNVTVPPSITEDLARFDREPDDDTLMAYALVHECDYLVTDNRELLAIGQVRNVHVVQPTDFLEIVLDQLHE
jgi:putative PIN family toxin of toxin-antitoxin system